MPSRWRPGEEFACNGLNARYSSPRRARRLRPAAALCPGLGMALDRAGIPAGGRVAIRLPDPLGYATARSASWPRAGSLSRSIRPRPPDMA
jgi:hypothetical protein